MNYVYIYIYVFRPEFVLPHLRVSFFVSCTLLLCRCLVNQSVDSSKFTFKLPALSMVDSDVDSGERVDSR